MDLNIETPGIHHNEKLIKFLTKRLEKKYAVYPFIPRIDAKVEHQKETYTISLQVKPEKGPMLFAKGVDAKKNKALDSAIKKLNHQIERYKQKHYQSANRTKPDIGNDV